MTNGRRLLAVIAAASVALLLAFLALGLAPARKRPDDVRGLASWIGTHPADWQAASDLTDKALDSDLPYRIDLWRQGYALGAWLAPRRTNPAAAFVRAGLFHWYELSPRDRQSVLDAAVPLLADEKLFVAMHESLWQLTNDFGYLRRVAPRTRASLERLRDLAVRTGRFDDYRAIRGQLRDARLQTVRARHATAGVAELLDLLPSPLTADDVPLVHEILAELDRRTFEPQQLDARIDTLTTFALDRHLRPLEGLSPLIDAPAPLHGVTRARLALALGQLPAATRVEATTGVSGSREWVPYYLERARFEAARRDRTLADGYLARAALSGATPPVLDAAREVASQFGDAAEAARIENLLAAPAQREWEGSCGAQELCTTAATWRYVTGATLDVTAVVVQTDEVPPYVELYVDGSLAGEGAVSGTRTFQLEVPRGLHRIEARLVNRYTHGGIQRRVRLS